MLEAADFHPGRSGREHLATLALAARVPLARVDALTRESATLESAFLELTAGRRR